MANINPDIVFRMPFHILSGADIDFLKKEFLWKYYTIEKAFFITKQVELVRKKEFIAAALDSRYETFVIYIASLRSPSNNQKIMFIFFAEHK